MNKPNQRLTIGIPTMNRAAMLGELLSDIETYQSELPIIISDNSENDDTQQLVEWYSRTLNIRYIRIRNRLSQAENFNLLLSHVSTPYVVMMHDDDRFLPNSLANYLALLDHFVQCQANVIATYILPSKFRNKAKLEKIVSESTAILSLEETQNSLKVFRKSEFIKYFIDNGVGGEASGVLLNWNLMQAHELQFPTDAGAKHDKAFFLTANATGDVAYWPQRVIAKRLHQNRSIHRNITHNYCAFNQKLAEIYSGDLTALGKVHRKRIEKWMKDEPRFRPGDFLRLLNSSRISSAEKILAFAYYALFRFPRILIRS